MGVSRATNNNNESQGAYYDRAVSTQDQCGTNVQVAPDHDVNVCDGQMVESANDTGLQTILAAYPRQPFNFAGGPARSSSTCRTTAKARTWRGRRL